MTPPSIPQQRGLSYAPMPFAALSLLSSCCVIRHILRRGPASLRRMYGRLVLAMNLALALLAVADFWGTLAVPRGTPRYIGAAGTVGTCTAQGFINLVCAMTVPSYYGSLSLQAYLSITKNFREDQYKHVEKWIHLFAWCVPITLASVVAATENINPAGSGCWVSKAPRGCEVDPDVQCERGKDIEWFVYIFGVGQLLLYFFFPPAVVALMHRWLQRRKTSIDENVKRRMMNHAAIQMKLYLTSFWSTFVFGMVYNMINMLTKKTPYNFLIFANCVFAMQGFIFSMVYFTLQRMGQKGDFVRRSFIQHQRQHNTSGTEHDESATPCPDAPENIDHPTDEPRSVHFNIFDGTLEDDSPWAEFFRDESDSSDGGVALPELPPQLQWRPDEGDADKNLDMRTKLYLYENVLRL